MHFAKPLFGSSGGWETFGSPSSYLFGFVCGTFVKIGTVWDHLWAFLPNLCTGMCSGVCEGVHVFVHDACICAYVNACVYACWSCYFWTRVGALICFNVLKPELGPNPDIKEEMCKSWDCGLEWFRDSNVTKYL